MRAARRVREAARGKGSIERRDLASGRLHHRLFSAISMNWRGRPLTSHEVAVSTIAATTTRTGLRVHAELDTGSYATGAKISDAQLAALPLTHHDWHPDWNYTLAPRASAPPAPAPRPPARARPDLAWLTHPAITGLPARALDALTAAPTGPAAQLREAALNRRRGDRPRQLPGNHRRPRITLTHKLIAAILHDRHGLPHRAIAALYQVRHQDICRHVGDIRLLLRQTGHTIEPSPHTLATLDDLYRYAAAQGIAEPAEIKTAC